MAWVPDWGREILAAAIIFVDSVVADQEMPQHPFANFEGCPG